MLLGQAIIALVLGGVLSGELKAVVVSGNVLAELSGRQAVAELFAAFASACMLLLWAVQDMVGCCCTQCQVGVHHVVVQCSNHGALYDRGAAVGVMIAYRLAALLTHNQVCQAETCSQ